MNSTTFLARFAAGARAQRPTHAASLLRWCVLAVLCASVVAFASPQSALAQSPLSRPDDDAAAAAPAPVAKSNRLKIGTLVDLDPRKGTVGDAMRYLLEPVHYRITHRTVDPLASAAVLRRPIPPVARHAGVMSIEDALLLLIGEENRLVVDHAHRLIAIERMPDEPDVSPQ